MRASALLLLCGYFAVGSDVWSEEQRTAAAPVPDALPSAASEPVPVASLIRLARQRNTTRAMLDANRAIAEAAVMQAGAWANPTLDLDGGQARIRDSGDHVLTGRIALTQRLEWPGRRDRRVEAAQAGISMAADDAALLILDLESDVRHSAIDLAAAELGLQQAQRSAELAHQVRTAIDHRLAAGDADHGDRLRAELDERQAGVLVDQRRRAVIARRAALRALCGTELSETVTVPDAWPADAAPTLAQAHVVVGRHPSLQRLRSQRQQQVAAMRQEELAGRPDFTVGAYAGRGSDSNEVGVTLGVDLPLWSRNQGGVALARAELQRTDAQIAAEELALTRAVTAAWYADAAAREHRGQLINEVEPLATAAVDLRLRAFKSGDVGLAEVLDAKRTAITVADAIIDARAEAAAAWVRLTVAMGGIVTPPAAQSVEQPR